MSKSGFDYSQYEKFVKNLDSARIDFELWLKKFLLQEAQRCVAYAKQRQSAIGAVDTGFMLNSWTVGSEVRLLKPSNDGKFTSNIGKNATVEDVKIVNDTLQVTIYNGAEYSSYVEYGTKYMEPRYILTVAMDRIYQAMPSRFNTEFIQYFKGKGIK